MVSDHGCCPYDVVKSIKRIVNIWHENSESNSWGSKSTMLFESLGRKLIWINRHWHLLGVLTQCIVAFFNAISWNLFCGPYLCTILPFKSSSLFPLFALPSELWLPFFLMFSSVMTFSHVFRCTGNLFMTRWSRFFDPARLDIHDIHIH